jgi:hypothetical protein
LPNQLTAHGFGQDGNGEIYAMTTDTPSSGNGGVVYKLVPMSVTIQGTGNQLDITWPTVAGHLQSQTNLNASAAAWVTVPGSTTTNHVVVPVDPTSQSVFYRLAVP